MMLPSAPLGRTGMTLSRVGLGTWAVGGGGWARGWGNQDDEDSVAAICHAVERGVNWIDTAAVYGLGHSEEVVGTALRRLPRGDRPFVFTKCGRHWDPRDPQAPLTSRLTAASVRAECDASLRRLGAERIDLYQVHWPSDDGTPVEEYWGALARLRDEGKIAAAGLSNHTLAQVQQAAAISRVDSVQPPFSAVRRDAVTGLIPWCATHDIGVIAYSPMQSGLLTGAFSAERAASLGADDWRSADPDFTQRLQANLAVAGALKMVAGRHGVTTAAVAVAWVLAWPGITGAIVGARRPGQVDGWLPAAALRLSEEDLDDIARVIVAEGAGTGPSRPAGEGPTREGKGHA